MMKLTTANYHKVLDEQRCLDDNSAYWYGMAIRDVLSRGGDGRVVTEMVGNSVA